ncbi:class I SAM-dependent methyltransferase [Starkeya sp. ORNL1]|uniref:class I SAM-dependent methyltransferase n=1 Tax=Starkeya sp. ORNL1 TaxID=2709380 RepID=UPI001462A62E|nr:SAM-dependent methyltransferase [Starkeya sp. ORNL1]QJP17178.1 class I SAM-dependent methyltransferase [Starkeya sp. ORNL1]
MGAGGTELGRRLARDIAATGPMTAADYMERCLFDPASGYYTTAEVFGAKGDFITAPEISQVFGELLGLWAADSWLRIGSPSPFVLAELGPGRGTMMADMLRATRIVPGFHDAMRVVLVEASKRLRARQEETLAAYTVEWCARVAELPPGPLIALANEFFDALPIRQFIRTPEGLAERMVGIADDGALSWGLRPGARLDAEAEARLVRQPPGSIFEICPAGFGIARTLAERVTMQGGAVLAIDYGHAGGFGDTLQALRDHAFDDPLAHPGEADLTAHVDFGALARAAKAAGARAFGPVTQATLLERLGLTQRAERLKRDAAPEARTAVDAAAARLTGRGARDMGELFKALAIVHPDMHEVAGFAPDEEAA